MSAGRERCIFGVIKQRHCEPRSLQESNLKFVGDCFGLRRLRLTLAMTKKEILTWNFYRTFSLGLGRVTTTF